MAPVLIIAPVHALWIGNAETGVTIILNTIGYTNTLSINSIHILVLVFHLLLEKYQLKHFFPSPITLMTIDLKTVTKSNI
jgi:hypothetical protein